MEGRVQGREVAHMSEGHTGIEGNGKAVHMARKTVLVGKLMWTPSISTPAGIR